MHRLCVMMQAYHASPMVMMGIDGDYLHKDADQQQQYRTNTPFLHNAKIMQTECNQAGLNC